MKMSGQSWCIWLAGSERWPWFGDDFDFSASEPWLS
jgi:hypothetical protein